MLIADETVGCDHLHGRRQVAGREAMEQLEWHVNQVWHLRRVIGRQVGHLFPNTGTKDHDVSFSKSWVVGNGHIRAILRYTKVR